MNNQNIEWICVFKTSRRFEAEAVKGNFESEDIPCILLNKQDSNYLAFGYIELHVPKEFKKAAELILLSQDFNPTEN